MNEQTKQIEKECFLSENVPIFIQINVNCDWPSQTNEQSTTAKNPDFSKKVNAMT